MQITGQATILKDDRGTYKLAIANKENDENGEEKTLFMRINVGFRKGVEVKNKTKIDIKNAFLTFFRIDTGEVNENGNTIYKKFPKIMIMDFDVLEEGVDEVFQRRDYSNTQSNVQAPENEIIGSFETLEDDELPF